MTAYGTALRLSCQNRFHDRALIEAVVRTYPQALCVAHGALGLPVRLPYEVAAEIRSPDDPAVEYLTEETLHVALAAVELALESLTFLPHDEAKMDVVGELPSVPDESDMAIDDNSTGPPGAGPSPAVDEFRRKVLSTVASRIALPAGTVRASGFASAQVLRIRDDCLDVCRELFACPVTSRRMSDDDDATFRDAVLNGTAMSLYRLNKAGGRADPSPHHHFRLLALVSGNLDCVYREAGAVRLVGRRSGA